MSMVVTLNTERYQIVEPIMPEFASSREMVYLQVLWCTAVLASPAVPFEHLVAKGPIGIGVKLLSRSFPLKLQHRFSFHCHGNTSKSAAIRVQA